jgi:hypothetical protein
MNEGYAIVKSNKSLAINIQFNSDLQSIGSSEYVKNIILGLFSRINFSEEISGLELYHFFRYGESETYFEIGYIASHQYKQINNVYWIDVSFGNRLALKQINIIAKKLDAKVLDIQNMKFL